MTALNRVILTGRVVNPPRPQYRPDGSPVVQFPLELDDSEDQTSRAKRNPLSGRSLNEMSTPKGGGNRINIVAFGKLAELKLDILQRGQRIMVVGKLHQRRWQTPEGKNRIQTEVIATELKALEEKKPIEKPKK